MTRALSGLGYTTEQVLAWYKPITSMNDEDGDEDLKAMLIDIAYKERPEELNKEKPMLVNLYKLEDVFAMMLKKVILEKFFVKSC